MNFALYRARCSYVFKCTSHIRHFKGKIDFRTSKLMQFSTLITNDSLSELLIVPMKQRSAEWVHQFSGLISKAKLSNGTNGSEDTLIQITGPDGFKYAILYYPDHPWYQGPLTEDPNKGNGRFYTLDDVARKVLEAGDGIVINYKFDTSEVGYILTHGDVLQQFLGGTALPWIPNSSSPGQNLPQGHTAIPAGIELTISSPSDLWLPPFTRKGIREMLINRKLPSLQVCVLKYDNNGIEAQDLAFFAEIDALKQLKTQNGEMIPESASCKYILQCLSWFLPKNTSITIRSGIPDSFGVHSTFVQPI